MSKLVVDASVAAKWLVSEPLSDRALAVLGGSDELSTGGISCERSEFQMLFRKHLLVEYAHDLNSVLGAKRLDVFSGAILDPELPNHVPHVADLDGGILTPTVAASRKTRIGDLPVRDQPVVLARLLGVPGSTVIEHRPDVLQRDGPGRRHRLGRFGYFNCVELIDGRLHRALVQLRDFQPWQT
jgi:hypothetical protein